MAAGRLEASGQSTVSRRIVGAARTARARERSRGSCAPATTHRARRESPRRRESRRGCRQRRLVAALQGLAAQDPRDALAARQRRAAPLACRDRALHRHHTADHVGGARPRSRVRRGHRDQRAAGRRRPACPHHAAPARRQGVPARRPGCHSRAARARRARAAAGPAARADRRAARGAAAPAAGARADCPRARARGTAARGVRSRATRGARDGVRARALLRRAGERRESRGGGARRPRTARHARQRAARWSCRGLMRERLTTLACALGALLLIGTLLLRGDTGAARRASPPTTLEHSDNGLLGARTWLQGEGVRTLALRERFGALLQQARLPRSGNLLIVSLPAVTGFSSDEALAIDRWIRDGNTLLVLAALRDRPGWAPYPFMMANDLLLLTDLSFAPTAEQHGERSPAQRPAAAAPADRRERLTRLATELESPELGTLVPNRAHPFFSGVTRAEAL